MKCRPPIIADRADGRLGVADLCFIDGTNVGPLPSPPKVGSPPTRLARHTARVARTGVDAQGQAPRAHPLRGRTRSPACRSPELDRSMSAGRRSHHGRANQTGPCPAVEARRGSNSSTSGQPKGPRCGGRRLAGASRCTPDPRRRGAARGEAGKAWCTIARYSVPQQPPRLRRRWRRHILHGAVAARHQNPACATPTPRPLPPQTGPTHRWSATRRPLVFGLGGRTPGNEVRMRRRFPRQPAEPPRRVGATRNSAAAARGRRGSLWSMIP